MSGDKTDSSDIKKTIRLRNLQELKTFRKKLRKTLTPAEAKLWSYLKNKQLAGRRFKRQYSVGNAILDFYCPSEKLAIELDGEVHNNHQSALRDDERTLFLEYTGIKILRFENKLIFENPEGVLFEVSQAFEQNNSSGDGRSSGLVGE